MKTMMMPKLRKIQVPVMRNGKPTKRMKEVYESFLCEVEMDCIEHEGHKVYFEKESRFTSMAYREDGTLLTGEFIYGRYGKELHKEGLFVRDRKLVTSSTGYNGSTTKGWGGRLVKINW